TVMPVMKLWKYEYIAYCILNHDCQCVVYSSYHHLIRVTNIASNKTNIYVMKLSALP
ncbi:hypothetical protein BgiMline_036104, partial [Biomphalaria glabrata]